MKRLTIIALALALVGGACTSGTTVGGDLGDVSDKIKKTKTPDPKPSKTKADPKPSKTVDKEPDVEVNEIIIAVRDNFEGFEYKQPGAKWRPATDGGPSAFVGDVIIFKNMDKQGFVHGWANEATGSFKAGEIWDSGKLQPGEEFRFELKLEPGNYPYKDSAVPYRAAQGPMVILPR